MIRKFANVFALHLIPFVLYKQITCNATVIVIVIESNLKNGFWTSLTINTMEGEIIKLSKL